LLSWCIKIKAEDCNINHQRQQWNKKNPQEKKREFDTVSNQS